MGSTSEPLSYQERALDQLQTGDDGTSFFFSVVSESRSDEFYKVRIFSLFPTIGCSAITCECPHHFYRQMYCKHEQVVVMACTGGTVQHTWQLPFLVLQELRLKRLHKQVRIYHLTDWSLVLALPPTGTPIGVPLLLCWPQWRIRQLEDLQQVWEELLQAIAENQNVA